ncbi:hypothetical protein JR316_0006029 [Psilocybe cubensis]|uniref:Uncharacterized protein n=2 Tax=Psilocybe cubensis TaxID=181762 RepID=A0ACB8H1F1_PSICU|nr:hypothetical protein JR316_0006029 [Psilocybe cubensis]KAH9481502.1 hypothetical protein JR316_0006029 [Psilocybe cubensis]
MSTIADHLSFPCDTEPPTIEIQSHNFLQDVDTYLENYLGPHPVPEWIYTPLGLPNGNQPNSLPLCADSAYSNVDSGHALFPPPAQSYLNQNPSMPSTYDIWEDHYGAPFPTSLSHTPLLEQGQLAPYPSARPVQHANTGEHFTLGTTFSPDLPAFPPLNHCMTPQQAQAPNLQRSEPPCKVPTPQTIDMNYIHQVINEHAEPSLPVVPPPQRSISMGSFSVSAAANADATTSGAANVEDTRRHLEANCPSHVLACFRREARQSVFSPAGYEAIMKRRENSARFLCKFCERDFTRKYGLDNHIKAHLGIVDKYCEFCEKSFASSLARHKKRCKFIPNAETV